MPRTRNSFNSGMVQDVDPNRQRPDTYRHALNGRIRFVEPYDTTLPYEERVKYGNSFAFINDKGTEDLLSICPGYTITGSAEVDNELVLFSTNGTYSEIGVVTIQEAAAPTATYKTLYNDRNDPNGKRLNFSQDPRFCIEARVSIESELNRRVYWVDGRNELRCINLELLFSNRSTRVPYHTNQSCGATVSYPKHLSVHQFNASSDITFGRIKYQERIPGRAKSGAFHLFYQLITKDGHHSAVSPITAPFLHHGETLVPQNHHKVKMGASNVVTNFGFRFTVEGIDTRWTDIRVGYAYATTDVVFDEIVFFNRTEITGTTMSFSLTRHGGVNVTAAYLNAKTVFPINPATLGIHKKKLFVGGFQLPVQPQVQLDTFNISPVYRFMDADETGYPTFSSENDVLTNSSPKTTTVTVRNFEGNNEVYQITGDYANYKGVQWSHLFEGWWRGDNADLGVVVYDLKGNTLFVQPLPSYTTPQQYENAHLTAINGGKYQLRILGLNVSGITFRHQDIFDGNGRLLISGFSIVRLKNNSQIKFQGIVVPAVRGLKTTCVKQNGSTPSEFLYNSTMPLPLLYNDFEASHEITEGKRLKKGEESQRWISEPVTSDRCREFFHEPYTFTIHAPDVMVEGAAPEVNETHRLKLVASCHTIDAVNPFRELSGNTKQYYVKQYKTSSVEGQIAMGNETRLSLLFYHNEFDKTYEVYDPDRKEEDKHYFHSSLKGRLPGLWVRSLLATGSMIAKAKDWKYVDVVDTQSNTTTSAQIVNYIVPQGLNTGSTNLAAQEYVSIGHFQPITESLLNQVRVGNNYTFNNIELYRGGCYANFVDMTRLYPMWYNEGDSDYSISHIVPLESVINYAMRYGRSFAANAAQARMTLLNNSLNRYYNGIMRQQPEDWGINRVLVNKRTTNTYAPQPANTTLRYDLPASFVWSNTKLSNEADDQYRKLLPGNFGDVDGLYGKITGMATLFDFLYIFQESGYSRARIDERAALSNQNGLAITLGTGEAFSGVDYVSELNGMTYRGGLGRLKNALYWMDVRAGLLCRHSQAGFEPISDIYGRHDTFSETCRLVSFITQVPRIIIVGHDYHNEVYVSIDLPGAPYLTTTFDESINAFTDDYNFQPGFMGKLNNYLLSAPINKGNNLHLHHYGARGRYYGAYQNTFLMFAVQGDVLNPNYFDNLLIHMNEAGAKKLKSIRVASINPSGQLHNIDLTLDPRKRYIDGSLRLPLREMTHLKSAVVSQGVYITIEVINDEQNVPVLISAVDTDYRVVYKR